MFQSCFLELVSGMRDILVGLSALAGPVMGAIGPAQQGAQPKSGPESQLAHRIASLACEFGTEFDTVRSPPVNLLESLDRPKEDNEDPKLAVVLDSRFAINRRLSRLGSVTSKLQEAMWEAELTLDKTVPALIKPLVDSCHKLSVGIADYFDSQLELARGSPTAAASKDTADPAGFRIFGVAGDKESKEIGACVEALVQTLRRYIKK